MLKFDKVRETLPLEVGMAPLISVLIATYNRPDFLREALESLRHIESEVEVVLVDDGSREEVTRNICNLLADRQIQFIRHKHNLGCSRARNTGIEHAHGDWILVLDDDDILISGVLPIYLQAINAYPDADVFYGDLVCFESNSRKTMGYLTYLDFYERPEGLLNLLIFGDFLPHPGALIRKEALLLAGGYDETLPWAEDYHLWSRLGSYCRFKHLNALTVNYRIHENQMTTEAVKLKKCEPEAKVLKELLKMHSLERLFLWLDWEYPYHRLYAHELIGIQFLLLGALEEAIPHLEVAATGAKGYSWRPKLLLAYALFLLGYIEHGRRILESVPECHLKRTLQDYAASFIANDESNNIQRVSGEFVNYLLHLRKEAVKKAIKHFGYHRTLFQRAKIYLKNGLKEVAIELCKLALSYEPHFEDGEGELFRLLSQN